MKGLSLIGVIFIFLFTACQEEKIDPTCRFVFPQENITYAKGVNINVLVQARDPDGFIKEIRLFVDNQEISVVNRVSKSYVMETNNLKPGNHILKALVTDYDNLTAETTINLKIKEVETGTFIDNRDGNEYKWVKIGEQTWMAENLAYLPEVNVIGCDSIEIIGYYCKNYNVYDYYGQLINEAKNTSAYKTIGVLYNWNAALDACPKGWHLPSNNEWQKLFTFISSENSNYSSNGNNWYGVGKHLKTPENTNMENGIWNESLLMNAGVDNYKFAALPGGYTYCGDSYYDFGDRAFWWTATEINTSYAVAYKISFAGSGTQYKEFERYIGVSVRCLKN